MNESINFNTNKTNLYDAIVVGSGISGGWAAKELCEKGLKTLVLERGRDVQHIIDYPTANLLPWQFENRLKKTNQDIQDNPIQSQSYDASSKHFYVSDKDHPYVQDKPFNWIRGYQVGGRSLIWGRLCFRWSDLDFEANLKDSIGVDWPIRYKDIEPWYNYVEKYIGVSGKRENLPQLPDGEFLPPIEMNCIEEHLCNEVKKKFSDRIVTVGRSANLTAEHNGKGPCQFRNMCKRGCPFTGYFSSNGFTIPDARSTGNLTLKSNCIVVELLYDKEKNRATGVRTINTKTGEVEEYFSKIIFLNASTINTAYILLNSKSEVFPEGLGNSSGQIGHNLMDHFVLSGATGEFYGYQDKYYKGRSPGCIYIPRFRNTQQDSQAGNHPFIRGYAFQGKGERISWDGVAARFNGIGMDLRNAISTPGPWKISLSGWGETLPYFDNRISLSPNKKDQWGMPLAEISMEFHENEEIMRNDILQTSKEMLEASGFENVKNYNYNKPPGSAIHEMGTTRMGRDPKTSVLNGFNQMHDVSNVFVTDGSCMASSGCQNPSLTYMALTARACDYAFSQLKSGKL